MNNLRTGRLLLVTTVAAVVCLLAYGAGWAVQAHDTDPSSAGRGGAAGVDTRNPGGPGGPGGTADVVKRRDRTPAPDPTPRATPEPTPELVPGPTLLATGDDGDAVRELQARLAQIDWFDADVTGYYGDVTAAAVRGFQAKRGFPATGEVDQRTLDRLEQMTTEPSPAELTGASTTNTPGALDPRCTTGRVLCVDKTSRTLRWVVDGTVLVTLDARFGASDTPTREGEFSVYYKDADHVSSLFGSAMPYSMFFSGGQAVHYSSDFAARGYAGASHGCVNIRDEGALAALYEQVRVGDRVVVYWS